jgi:hypothetical protein
VNLLGDKSTDGTIGWTERRGLADPPHGHHRPSLGDWLPGARFPSWPGAARSSTPRPKIRVQSPNRAPCSLSPSVHNDQASKASFPPPVPLGSPRRTRPYCGTTQGCQGCPSAASPTLTALCRPQCPRVTPTGGAAAASGESRGPPALPLGLDGGVQIRGGGAARLRERAPLGLSSPAPELPRSCRSLDPSSRGSPATTPRFSTLPSRSTSRSHLGLGRSAGA